MVTISNYSAVVNSAHTKISHFVFTSRFMVTDPNNGLCLCPSRLATVSQVTHCSNCQLSTLRIRVTLRLLFIANLFAMAPSHSRIMATDLFFGNWTLAVIALMEHPLWRENAFVALMNRFRFALVKCTYRTYGMLLKIPPFHYIQVLCPSGLWKADHV
jgi:hypothetical protein